MLQRRFLTFAPVMLVVLASTARAADVPTRDEIADQYKWDLSRIYADVDAWEADFARAEREIAALAERKTDAFESADELLATLKLRDEVRWLVDKLVVYSHQLSDQDTRIAAHLALKNRAVGLMVAYGEATAWLEPTLQQLDPAQLRAWYAASAPLQRYEHYLGNILRQKDHTLTVREEALLAMAGNVASSPGETYNVLKNAEMPWMSIEDEDGEQVKLSPGRFGKFIRSNDRRVRRDAFLGTMATIDQFRNTFAATLSGQVQANNLYAKARGFDSALASTLYPDNLPVDVVTSLVDTIHEHLPLLHRWAKVRKAALELDELHVWDLYQPLAQGSEREIEYDDAVVTVITALQPLGPEYCEPMEQGFQSRWIDVYETQGKRPGGYSWGSYETSPYILLNYNKTPEEMSTIAHEMGHSMHSFLSHANQPPVYGEYSMFVAEVAAIFNELLLQDYRLRASRSRAEKLALLNQNIDRLRATVFRQVMFFEFEYRAHELAQQGEALTADRLDKLYLDLFHEYWGPELVRDEEHGIYWARIPHFYMNHYVYRYASSYCAAAALAEKVLNKEPGALEAYLGFLKAGSSDYPLEILKRAGVDMTTPAPVRATMRRFERMVDEFEQLGGEIGYARQ
jgi:oligoendopeptidase F